MAITSSPRLGITRWSDPADPFTRAQMEASNAALDNLAAIDVAGLLASRPAAGVRGRWYATTDATKQLFREDGTTWHEVALIGDGKTQSLGTTTGTKIGTGTTQKLGFYGVTPVTQRANSVDLGVVLSDLGLRAAGGSYTLDPGSAGIVKAGASIQVNAAFIGAYAYNGFSAGTALRVLGSNPPTSPNNYVRVDPMGSVADVNLVFNSLGNGIVGFSSNPQAPIGTFAVNPNSNGLSFFGQALTGRQSITGSRGGNAALASLLTALHTIGLISDSTTA